MEGCVPYIFLTRNAETNDRDDIFMRKSGVALRTIRSSPVYNTLHRLDVNFLNILPRLECDAGEGRIGYPYDIAYGRGVLAAAVAGKRGNLGMWYKVYELETSLPEIEVR